MLWQTHFLAGAVAGFITAGPTDIKTAAIAIAVAGVSALLPDLDDPHSKMGRLVPIVSWAVKKVVGHRGPLHSLLGVGAVYILASLFLRSGHAYLVPMITVGYLSHIVIDSLNPEGCPWLWPAKIHFSIPLAEAGSLTEILVINPAIMAALIAICVLLAWPVIKSIVVVI